MDELVRQFKAGIANAKSEPNGVKVGLELWKALKSGGLIKMRSVAAWVSMTSDSRCRCIRTHA